MTAGISEDGYCASVRHWQMSTSFLAGHCQSLCLHTEPVFASKFPTGPLPACRPVQFGQIVQYDGRRSAVGETRRQARVWLHSFEFRGFGEPAVAEVVQPGGTTGNTSW